MTKFYVQYFWDIRASRSMSIEAETIDDAKKQFLQLVREDKVDMDAEDIRTNDAGIDFAEMFLEGNQFVDDIFVEEEL